MKIKTILIAFACVLLLGSSADNYGKELFQQPKWIAIGKIRLTENVILDAAYGQVRLLHRLCEIEKRETGTRFDLGGIDFPCREPSVWFGEKSPQNRYAFYKRFKSGEYRKALSADNEKYGWN